MDLYRGKEIGSRERLKDTCLKLIGGGKPEDIYHILPHLRLLRSPEFFPSLARLLGEGNGEQRSAAAAALGSLGDARSVEVLLIAFRQQSNPRRKGSAGFEAAVIESLGEIPEPESVSALMEIAESRSFASPPGERERQLLSSLGQLAQQSVAGAEEQLLRFTEAEEPEIRSLAVSELGLSYWHRPGSVPEPILQRILSLTSDPAEGVATAAKAALRSLAQLGSRQATQAFLSLRQRVRG